MNDIYADLPAMQHKYAVKSSGQSPSEYAAAVQGYRRPSSAGTLACLLALLVVSAAWLGVAA